MADLHNLNADTLRYHASSLHPHMLILYCDWDGSDASENTQPWVLEISLNDVGSCCHPKPQPPNSVFPYNPYKSASGLFF